MGLIEKVLTKLFPYTDIMRDDSNDIYLRRFFIYPRNKDFKKFVPRIYLHKFYRGDEDPHLHDHPWPFTSLILTRGYWEETEYNSRERLPRQKWRASQGEDGDWRIRTFYPIFSLLYRPATWRHRVILKDKKPVWTIVKTGIKERSWGFWIKEKLCPWRQYEGGVCWCTPEDRDKHMQGEPAEKCDG